MKTNRLMSVVVAGIAGLSLSAVVAGPKDLEVKGPKTEREMREQRELDAAKREGKAIETKVSNGLNSTIVSPDAREVISSSQTRFTSPGVFSLTSSCSTPAASAIAGSLEKIASNHEQTIVTNLTQAEAKLGLSQTLIMNGKEVDISTVRQESFKSENDPSFKQGLSMVYEWKADGVLQVAKLAEKDAEVKEIKDACTSGSAAACAKLDDMAYDLGVEPQIIGRIGVKDAKDFRENCSRGYGVRRAA